MANNGKSVLQRVDDVEQQTLSNADSLKKTNNSVRQLLNVFGALIDELGGEELDKKLAARIEAKMEAAKLQAVNQAKGMIQQLIESKAMEVVESLDKDCLVTFAEYVVNPTPAEEGKEPEYVRGQCLDSFVQMPAARFDEEILADLAGKKVGDVYRNGGTEIEISGIYKMLPPPAPVVGEVQAEDPTQVAGGSDVAPEAPAATEAQV